jgi:polysaccharide biosynthesis PFTS motif protein
MASTPLPEHAFADVPSSLRTSPATGPAIERCARQRLTVDMFAVLGLPRALLRAGRHPHLATVLVAPAEWRQVARDAKISVAEVRSRLAWWTHVVRSLAAGTKRAIRLLRAARQEPPSPGYWCFPSLPAYAAPRPGASLSDRYDFVTWCMRNIDGGDSTSAWLQIPQHTPGAWPEADAIVSHHPAPALRGSARLVLAVELAAAAVRAAVGIVRGRWGAAVLLADVVDALWFRRLEDTELAARYCFTYGSFAHRPLWTHVVADRGADVVLVCYSTSHRLVATVSDGSELRFPGVAQMSWDRVIVFDEHDVRSLRTIGVDIPCIQPMGPVDFRDADPLPEGIGRDCVALFDVNVHSDAWHERHGHVPEFIDYTATQVADFLNAVAAATSALDMRLVVKRKYDHGGEDLAPAYRDALERLLRSGGTIEAPPNMAARRLSEACAATIGIPLTTPPVLAHLLGRPAAYLDLVGIVPPDPDLTHGIPVLRTAAELSAWLQANVDAGAR